MKTRTAAVRGCLLGMAATALRFLTPDPVMAQCLANGWCHVGIGENGCNTYIRYHGRTGDIAAAWRASDCIPGEARMLIDCHLMRLTFIDGSGSWKPILPGTMGEAMMLAIC